MNRAGSWTVERREGGPARHLAIVVDSMREARAIITNWAFEIPSPTPLAWTRWRCESSGAICGPKEILPLTSAATVGGIDADCLTPSMLYITVRTRVERLVGGSEPGEDVTTSGILGTVLPEVELAATLGVEDDPPDRPMIDDDPMVVIARRTG